MTEYMIDDAEAMARMNKKELTPKEKALLEEIKSYKETISSLSGCLVSGKDFKEYIKDKTFNRRIIEIYRSMLREYNVFLKKAEERRKIDLDTQARKFEKENKEFIKKHIAHCIDSFSDTPHNIEVKKALRMRYLKGGAE